MTMVPDRSASCTCIRAVPWRSRRLRAGLAHRLQGPDAALVAGPAGLDPLADPGLLLGQLLVEEGVLAGLGRQELLLALEEGGVVAGPVEEAAPVELDDPGGQPAQEHPVVGDEDQRAPVAQEEVLQPADRLDVEVVGRLVEQEDVGLVDEGPGQQDAPLHPRGEGLEPGEGVEPHPGEDRLDPVVGAGVRRGPRRSSSPAATSSATVPPAARGDLLGEPGDPQALLADDLPLVGLELAPDQLQQRALPLAVAAEEAEPIAPARPPGPPHPGAEGPRRPGSRPAGSTTP